MARRSSRGMRKDRMWVTLSGACTTDVPANRNACNVPLKVVESVTGAGGDAVDILSVLRGRSGGDEAVEPNVTVSAARQFTILASHGFSSGLGGSRSLIAYGLGVQGGRSEDVDDLPYLFDNQNTGQWPAISFYNVNGPPGISVHSKAMRKVSLGQLLYGSMFFEWTDTAFTPSYYQVWRLLLAL